MRRSSVLVGGCLVIVFAAFAAPAWACSCSGFSSFDDIARRRSTSLVLVGRVLAIGEEARDRLESGDPTYVDVDVEWVAKGRAPARQVRVWNMEAGTSCGGALQMLSIGARASFALQTAADARRRGRELWDLLGSQIPLTDFVVPIVCGRSVLDSEEEARKYIGVRVR